MDAVTAIILAAGEGKRMRSRQPKILHRLCGRPLVGYPLRLARTFADRVVMVVPPSADGVAQVAGEGVLTVVQRERLGTGHAVVQAKDACGEGTILVLPGDMPLLTVETIERLLNHHKAASAAATLLTAIVDNPAGYGRVLRQRGRVARIVEDRDATDDQKKINEIGTSVYCFDARRLWSALAEVRPDNDQGEYYLTDVVAILSRAGATVEAVTVADPSEAQGVNDRKQLAAVAVVQRRRILDRLMESGVTIVDPASTYIEDTVTIGPDTVVQPQTVIEGATVIGSECVIGAGSHVSGSRLADRVVLKPYSIIEEAAIDEDATLGPFCHLRPGCHIGAGAEIGNFAELKKSRVGKKTKIHHVSYMGDATLGERVNVGAGTITCNYDGQRKHPTVIGDGVFVGTNSSLVAPLTIGEGAYVAAGSVITRDVPPGALALERSPQVVKDGWAAKRKSNTRKGD
ncbi:MAG: UDP-N-acetylglucosamine diphosphorylase/glucosamine-1-phosphate N-acetyltransferase [Candidatus Rokubacteria bacterium 13_1_20CM_4_68_9]|nr:MAG: UDP-N-acetylglucosamine diphosphorylase/glucosamine-1-phosphate N-acetyltransferase [Candidatus Rokubacteria bacterium 13_1_40CM_4_67_11]OLE01225.1 MAG: UDP-N-acetylglucosamine diphosphorylase/glucosamine-1-phosphate N-acetyltransferase [Candidatus Rokubacteria bacterium 13_1_20CM_4_68_9]PYN63573.1 MAG: bifunctional UDP-N-acetylglucosamine diphosphorylase/glucosamine-1-phosphate N-acetyltransferase GlmU [Candidatus Rokubacteria bacterium]